jgi:uracil-DNA glycosylase
VKAELDVIANLITHCQLCRLSETRTKPVPGRGDHNAAVMLIGEAPGAKEDRTGLPFVGDAGDILEELLAEASLTREGVFITNTVKCRPPRNRDPKEDEKDFCRRYLREQLNAIKPRIVVAVGIVSARSILSTTASMASLHGIPVKWGPYTVLPTYHPVARVRREVLREAFRAIPGLLRGEIVPEAEAEFRAAIWGPLAD